MSYTSIDPNVEGFVRRQIAVAFASPEEITTHAALVFDADEDRCRALVEAAALEHSRAQATWPERTDSDRLDAAFTDLEASGIVARQHFACCNGCGNYEMIDLLHEARERGSSVDGYVFYHWQDADDAADGSGLHLRFHDVGHRDAETIAIGGRVVAALRTHGLEATWDGTAERTIELRAFDWKRRWPPRPLAVAAPTATACIETWCDQLPRLAASDLAVTLGSAFGDACLASADTARALAWARAHRADAGRAAALARLAASCRGGAKNVARDLFLEALACAPWGCGAVIEVLLPATRADLEDPTLRAAVEERVYLGRRDVLGAAEIAWYLVRAELEPALEAAILERVEDTSTRQGMLDEGARVARDAAVWLLRHRRGDAVAAADARRRVLDGIAASMVTCPSFAVRALVAAAQGAGDLGSIAGTVLTHAETALVDLVDAYVSRGDVEGAFALALSKEEVWVNARLAYLAPDDPRASTWLDAAERGEAELARLYDEGLYAQHAIWRARLLLVAARARNGRTAPAPHRLLDVARAIATEASAEHGTRLAILEQLAGNETVSVEHAVDRLAPVEASWFTPKGAAALERALSEWEGVATDARTRFRARRHGGSIFRAAAAFARRGDQARAKDLVERGLGGAAFEMALGSQAAFIIGALAATHQMDRAVELYPDALHGADDSAAMVLGLLGHGQPDKAAERLTPALAKARSTVDLWRLAPAVLALVGAADPSSVVAGARSMVAAVARARAATSALTD